MMKTNSTKSTKTRVIHLLYRPFVDPQVKMKRAMAITAGYAIFIASLFFSFDTQAQTPAEVSKSENLKVAKLNAVLNDDFVAMEWYVRAEQEFYACVIERSSDNVHFEEIGVRPGFASHHDVMYVFVDNDPLPGDNYYRIKKVGMDETNFSQAALVNNELGSVAEITQIPKSK